MAIQRHNGRLEGLEWNAPTYFDVETDNLVVDIRDRRGGAMGFALLRCFLLGWFATRIVLLLCVLIGMPIEDATTGLQKTSISRHRQIFERDDQTANDCRAKRLARCDRGPQNPRAVSQHFRIGLLEHSPKAHGSFLARLFHQSARPVFTHGGDDGGEVRNAGVLEAQHFAARTDVRHPVRRGELSDLDICVLLPHRKAIAAARYDDRSHSTRVASSVDAAEAGLRR